MNIAELKAESDRAYLNELNARQMAELEIATLNRVIDALKSQLTTVTAERDAEHAKYIAAEQSELHQLRAENMRLKTAAFTRDEMTAMRAYLSSDSDCKDDGDPDKNLLRAICGKLTAALAGDGEAGPVDEEWLLANGFVLHKDRATAIDAESMTVTAGDYFEHGHVSVYRFNGKFTVGIKPGSQVSVEASRSAVLALLAALGVRQ